MRLASRKKKFFKQWDLRAVNVDIVTGSTYSQAKTLAG
jgi:hypothetical protein